MPLSSKICFIFRNNLYLAFNQKDKIMKKVLIIIISIALFNACKKDSSTIEDSCGTIKYEVSCSPAGFDITYENSSGNTEQQDVSSGSWTKSFNACDGDFVYISAQAGNENASISVKIYFNNNLIEKGSSSGDYVIADASRIL